VTATVDLCPCVPARVGAVRTQQLCGRGALRCTLSCADARGSLLTVALVCACVSPSPTCTHVACPYPSHNETGFALLRSIEALESQKREVLTMNDQMRAALAAQEKRATRNGERAARLEAQDARNKATIASLHRDMAKVAKENAELRTSLEREISESIAMRQEVVMLRQQVQVQANQAKAKVEGYASQYKAEAVQARARLLQMEKAFERAMAREDVIVRTGGGFVPLPRLLERYMSLAAAGDEGAVGSLDANSLLADLLPSPGPHVGPPGAAGAPAPAASFADRPQPARGGVSGGGRVRAAGPSAPVPNATAPQPVR